MSLVVIFADITFGDDYELRNMQMVETLLYRVKPIFILDSVRGRVSVI